MSKSNLIIIAVALIAIIAIVAYFEYQMPQATQTGSAATTTAAGASTGIGSSGSDATRAPAPTGIVVPSVGAQTSSSVAVPQSVTPANAHTTSQYRSFVIQADNNTFTPNTVIVNQDDIVSIVMTAVDKSYDFTQPDYGYHVSIAKGQTKTIQFGATASGKFTFYCASCGGPSSGPVGYIIVAPKQ